MRTDQIERERENNSLFLDETSQRFKNSQSDR